MSAADDIDAVRDICLRLRESDRVEVDAVMRGGAGWIYSVAPEAYRFALYKKVFRRQYSTKKAVPAAFFTAQAESSSTLRVALLATDDWPYVARGLVSWGLRTFKPQALRDGYSRAECRVHAKNHEAVSLLHRLGFVIEAEVARYSWCGEPFFQMAWTDNVPVQSSKNSGTAFAANAGRRQGGWRSGVA